MIDLLLGSDIGMWTLDNWTQSSISTILTLDDAIAKRARDLGLSVIKQNANYAEYQPAPIGLSVHYPRIIKQSLLDKYDKLYNLHPSYLPWGKGYYPIFWAMWEETPAGATLHEITAEVDSGPIVYQIEVPYTEEDTGYSLYLRVRKAEQDIIRAYEKRIISGEKLPSKNQYGPGTYHTKQEFLNMKRNPNWKDMSSEQLMKLIRCLSFPEYNGLEVELGNKKFSVRLEDITNES